jgi:FlaA1/EpsC-like NDP-sugar epimerase
MIKDKNQIETTGPEMYRFFFTVDEAVKLVLTAMLGIQQFQGKVLSRQMKSAQMKDIIQVWIEQTNGSCKEIIGRPGERNEEFLFGELELPFTQTLEIDDVTHYLIAFDQRVENPVKHVLSSRNAEKLTRNEIIALINNPPIEEM